MIFPNIEYLILFLQETKHSLPNFFANWRSSIIVVIALRILSQLHINKKICAINKVTVN